MNSPAIGTGPRMFDSATEGAGQRVSQLRDKAAIAEQRALSAAGPIERAFYKAESASYHSLALEVEKLRQIAARIDMTTATILRENASVLSKFTHPPDDRLVGRTNAPPNRLGDEKKISEAERQREASPDVLAARNAKSGHAVQPKALIDESQLLETQTAERIDPATAAIVNNTPSPVEGDKTDEDTRSREAPVHGDAALPNAMNAGAANDESPALEVQEPANTVESINASMSAVIPETPSLLNDEKLPPTYGYVAHIDAPWDFFRGEDRITEEEWRREAPANQIASLPSGATQLYHTRAGRERVLTSVRQALSLREGSSKSR
jgi:hypothetical protein